jgi:hypothetical protein
MNCIYLNCDERGCHCQAQVTPSYPTYYKPTGDELKKFCQNAEEVYACPRLQCFERYLKASKT